MKARRFCLVGLFTLMTLLAWASTHPMTVQAQAAPVLAPASAPDPTLVAVTDAVVEDFADIVTAVDLGFDDFSGNTGVLNKDGRSYGRSELVCAAGGNPCVLRFQWDFTSGSDPEAFTGLFYSLFGLTDTLATFDGQNVETVRFPEHSLDVDRVDGALAEPDGPRRFESLGATLTYTGAEPLKLRVELRDTDGGGRFTRFEVAGSAQPQTLTWRFREAFSVVGGRDLDLTKVKVLTFIIERRHVGDGVSNPDRAAFDLGRIWFVPDRPAVEPASDAERLDLVERRAYQYFLDWASRNPGSLDVPQDRSTFADLLTVGGVGFALPAHAIAAERGWIPRADAAQRVLNVLRVLDDDAAFGPARVGRKGHRGFFYHFLGVDGRRKLNFDFPETPVNEALNTVEVSTIDTGLALMGVLAAQTYFDRADPVEGEIRDRAQRIYDRVDWPFMLEPASRQFYLGWKPEEGPGFQIPDAANEGFYSGVPGDPATLDFYTDEALIPVLLGTRSKTHPVSPSVYCALQKDRDAHGLVRSWPGSLFTYQFLRAFIDTPAFPWPSCPGESPIDWYANSRQAIWRTIEYVRQNPRGFQTYGEDAWGLSAAEGPDDRYRAYAAPPVARDPAPPEDGTVTYYAMLSAATFGDDLRSRADGAARPAWQRGHWHWRFGLPDAFNDEIDQAGLPSSSDILRRNGPWAQRALFAIDQGPMLLHLENTRSGLVWRLLANNPPPPPPLCPMLPFGTTSEGTIDPAGEVDCFTFPGEPGDRIRLRVVAPPGSGLYPLLELRRPSDTPVTDCPAAPGELTCSLAAAGAYTVLVRDYYGTGTGPYHIHLQRLNNPVGCTAPVPTPLGTTQPDTIDLPAQIRCFRFDGAAGDQVRVRAVAAPGSGLYPLLELVGPDGDAVPGCPAALGELTCRLATPGTHAVLIRDYYGSGTGGYHLHLQRLNNPQRCTLPLLYPPGTTRADTIDLPAQIRCWRFDGAEGDQVRVWAVAAPGSGLYPFLELVGPDGDPVPGCPAALGEPTCRLAATGAHAVLVRDYYGSGTGAYHIYLQRLNNPERCTTLAFGTTQAGSIDTAGEVDCDTFGGAVGDRVRVRAVAAPGSGLYPLLELFGPDGTPVPGCPRALGELTCHLAAPGRHTLLVRDYYGTGTGPYHIHLQRLNGPEQCTPPIHFPFGTTQPDTIDLPAQMRCYRFDGAAGDQVRVRAVAAPGSGLYPLVELVEPDGGGVPGCPAALWELTCTLRATGTHAVLVRDYYGSGTGGYTFGLECLSGSCLNPKQPDLVITSFVASAPGADQPIALSITVENRGMASTGSGFHIHLFADRTTPPTTDDPPQFHMILVEPLSAGASVVINDSLPAGSLTSGTHTLWALVDGHAMVPEADETNNTFSIMLVVPPAPAVKLTLDPSAPTVPLGASFDVVIRVDAGAQPVDGAEVYLEFDPCKLLPVDSAGNPATGVRGGTALSLELRNEVHTGACNEDIGRIHYAAGADFGAAPPSGSFTLAAVTFRAQASTAPGCVQLIFLLTSPRKTDLTYGGKSVLGEASNGCVTILAKPSLRGSVAFEGRGPAGDPHWEVPLRVTLSHWGMLPVITSLEVTTDRFGNFKADVPPGCYTVSVKHAQTLGRIATDLCVGPPDSPSRPFGTLLTGDVNDDNQINTLDFSILRAVFGTCAGDPRYDGRADLEVNGCIDLVDFSWLRTNFGQAGWLPAPPVFVSTAAAPAAATASGTTADEAAAVRGSAPAGPRRGSVRLTIQPDRLTQRVGDVFQVRVDMDAGDQPVDGVQVHLAYDPRLLRVVDAAGAPAGALTPGPVFDAVLENRVDHERGRIAFAAGALAGAPARGRVTVATLTVRALQATGPGPAGLRIVDADGERTLVSGVGASLPLRTADGQVVTRAGAGPAPSEAAGSGGASPDAAPAPASAPPPDLTRAGPTPIPVPSSPTPTSTPSGPTPIALAPSRTPSPSPG